MVINLNSIQSVTGLRIRRHLMGQYGRTKSMEKMLNIQDVSGGICNTSGKQSLY